MLRMLARDRKVTVFTREGGREREREDVRNMLASSKGVVDSCCSAVITLSLSLSLSLSLVKDHHRQAKTLTQFLLSV